MTEAESTPTPTTGTEVPEQTPEAMPDVESAFAEIDVDSPLVGIIMGSANDKPKMQPAGKALEEAGIRYEVRVMSAHRTPDLVVVRRGQLKASYPRYLDAAGAMLRMGRPTLSVPDGVTRLSGDPRKSDQGNR